MRLIDADALIAELQKDEERFDKEAEDAKDDPSYTEGYSDAMWSRANGIRDAIIEIHDAPSIDIVFCKECKHRYVSGHTTQYYICDFLDAQNKDDGFCSYGQKGDENVETD